MAFFEFIKRISTGDFSSITNAFGNLIKPIGAMGTGSFVPSPSCFAEGPAHYGAGAIQVDSAGNTITRSLGFTDEGGIRDDFAAIVTSLTGTLTFVNGSKEVTGVGTLFKTELTNRRYIKLNANSELSWAKVIDISSDTHLEIDTNYVGASASGASSYTMWPTSTVGVGGTRTAANSIFTIGSGTTAGNITLNYRSVDFCPLNSTTYASVSQRIANQSALIGFSQDIADPINAVTNYCACFLFDGAVNTVVKCVTRSGANSAPFTETITATIPGASTTDTYHLYEISITADFVKFSIDGIQIADMRTHIPDPYSRLNAIMGWINGGAAPISNSNLLTDSSSIRNDDRIELSNNYQGSSLPIRVREETHYVTGSIVTNVNPAVETTIASYTVPAGRTLRIISYTFSGDNSSIFGQPFRVSLAPPNNLDPVPGTVDGIVFDESISLGRTDYSQDFTSCPITYAGPGQTVYLTVKPSAQTSTRWYARMDFILRS